MATTDLKTFLEDRLTVLDPTIDLSPGSPAQVQFIDPVIAYLGTDPLETDIKTFILDRFEQEFPDVFSGDPGVVGDTFVKPLILMLEPFKREIQQIRKNQSLKDPSVLSDDDADALVANVFDERSEGGLSGGVARVFYANPTNVQVEITARVFTADGLNFYPSVPVSITAEEMVFNKSGGLFFMDFTVQAEQEGVEYNITKNSLTGVQGITGAIKVDNPRDFADGASKLDTPTFVAQARGSLTERSMVTRRGATATLRQAFESTVRAVQIIGAGDGEMQRDILSATSPGHAFLTGKVGLFQQMAYVRCRTMDSGSSTTPTVVVGDQVYVYLHPMNPTYAGVSQQDRFVRLTISEVLLGPMQHPTDPEYQVSYLVRYEEEVPAVMTADVAVGEYFEGGISKKGTVTISSLPSIQLTAPITVNSQEVHTLGHSDIYVRPVLQKVSTSVINSLSADPGLTNLQRSTLSSYGTNKVADTDVSPIDFEAAGVVPGNFLIVESGSDIGTYVIRKVDGSTLYLGASLTSTASSIRYRVVSDLTINPFDPRILKLPFGTVPNNDLQTVIGSNTIVFTAITTDLLNYGAKVGDTVKVSGSAVDNGTFTITGFIDGQNVLVDRPAAASESGLTYEVYTSLEAVQLPLVRLKELTVLDSAKQSTGVIIPPADPVAVVPAGNITSAQVRGHSERRSGFILPDLTQFGSPLPISPAADSPSTPAGRYSSGFVKELGVYGRAVFANGTKDEFDYLPQMFGRCSYFVSVAEDTTKTENFPPIAPKPGDALTIKSGPNKGDYLIKDVVKFRYTKAGPSEFIWAYLIEIYGTFPVDVIAELVAFINQATPGAVPTFNYSTTDLPVPSYLQTTIYSNLASDLQTALLTYSATAPTIPELQSAIDSMVLVDYEWGDPARGVLRTFFSHPTLFQQNTAASLNPTLYSFKTTDGAFLKFRADPNRYDKHEIVPPRLDSDTDPLEYPRDDEELWLLPYTGLTGSFVVGNVLTGGTSTKTGTIVADVKYGTTGTLVLRNVSGAYAYPETITGSGGGSATTASLRQPGMLFTSASRASVFNLEVQPGDVVGVQEEFFLHGSTGTQYAIDPLGPYTFPAGKNYMSAVSTVFNSTQVTFNNSDTPFIQDMVGGMLFIEEGKDKSGYQITKVIDSKNLVLDKPLTETTPTILASGDIDTWGYDSPNLQDRVQSTTAVFNASHVNKYITIYGMQKEWQGSYKILTLVSSSFVAVDRAGFPAIHFPTQPFAGYRDGYWVITDAPTTTPTKVRSGTELFGLRPIHIYRSIETEYPITTVLTSPITSVVGFDHSKTLDFCDQSPFRIFRRNIRRINPYEMSLQTQGGLFYFDTETVSVGPGVANNLTVQSYLTADEGTYESEGYKHLVDDFTLTYSVRETGRLFIPSTILPVSSPDSAENRLSLVGVPLQVSYDRGDIVQNVQDFISSTEDRVTTANMLARHFLPSYVYYDAVYIGGSSPGVIAKDIISYIDNLAVETPIDVSLIQQLIENRGGNIETPTTVFIIIHDWDRRQWMEFSANRLGGNETRVPYNGTPRVSFFVPGPDVSGQDPLPEGERVNLVQV